MDTSRRVFFNKLTIGIAASTIIPRINLQSEEQIFLKNGEINWDEVRKNFPLSKERIYFNNGTFGPSPNSVIEKMKNQIDEINATGDYGSTSSTINSVAHFINAEESEIALTHNTTEGINIMAFGVKMKADDEIIMCSHEHVGNAMPWLNRAKRDHLKIRVFDPGNTREENISAIKSLINSKTRVIAIPHIPCTTGIVFPIAEIAEIAREKNIITAIDGAHGVGTFNFDIRSLGVDMYASCCHKWLLGPAGTGFVFINNAILPDIEAIHVGAYSDSGWKLDTKEQEILGFNPTAHRFFYGTQGKAHFSGVDAAIDFHQNIGSQEIEDRIRFLNNYLYQGLQQFPKKLDILTPKESVSRLAMVSFKPKNTDYKEFGHILNEEKIRVRQVPESGLNAIRISTHIYNSTEEIDYLLKVIEDRLK